MNNKRGFSLVELIVVMAIMGVALTAIGLSFSVVTNRRVKSTASNLYSVIGNAQTVAMSKDNCKLVVWYDSSNKARFAVLNSQYGVLMENEGTAGIPVYVDGSEIIPRTGYIITFNRATGQFAKTYTFSDFDGDYTALKDNYSETAMCSKITVGSGSRAISIQLIAETGKYMYVD